MAGHSNQSNGGGSKNVTDKSMDDDEPEKMDFSSKLKKFDEIATKRVNSTLQRSKRVSTPNFRPFVSTKPLNHSLNSVNIPNKARSSSPVSDPITRLTIDHTKKTQLKAMQQENNACEIENRPVSVHQLREQIEKFQSLRSNQSGKFQNIKSSSFDFVENSSIPDEPRFVEAVNDPWSPVTTVPTEINESFIDQSSSNSIPFFNQDDSSDVSFSDEEEIYQTERKTKLRRCIEEVHQTEQTYVKILYVLSTKLSVYVKETCAVDDESLCNFNKIYKPLLGSIQAIYKLHHDSILPEMAKFVNGESNGNMWNIFKQYFKCIEVIYKDYYVQYDANQTKIDELCQNNKLIHEAMLKCQSSLDNLYPTTQFNCPNQRLLRYILCMKTYLKYLDKEHEEYRETSEIHDQLDRIAVTCEEGLVTSPNQLNELCKRLENRSKLADVQSSLIWHGRLKKQSPRLRTDIIQRYVIVFHDRILVCKEESTKRLEVKRELSMKNLTLEIVNDERMPNSTINYFRFRVNAVEKSYEFLTEKETDRDVWIRKIQDAINKFNRQNLTVQTRLIGLFNDDQKNLLGTRAPVWVPDVDVSRCQICNNRFRTGLNTGRHHCRSCGQCICKDCSSKRLILPYCQSEGELRICDTCYITLTGNDLPKNSAIWPKRTRDALRTVLFGDFRPVNSNTSVWFSLQEDLQLHVYAARLDQAEDFVIKLIDLVDFRFDSDSRTFSFQEINKQHKFILESNHQLTYPKNDWTLKKLQDSPNELIFFSDLWQDAIQTARTNSLPAWYVRKRDSSDSGVSNGS